jgi:hypothetical protein
MAISNSYMQAWRYICIDLIVRSYKIYRGLSLSLQQTGADGKKKSEPENPAAPAVNVGRPAQISAH